MTPANNKLLSMKHMSYLFFMFGLVFSESEFDESENPPVQDIRSFFKPGVICNYDYYLTTRGRLQQNYMCVPSTACKNNTFRSPAIPYDSCDINLKNPDPEVTNVKYVCCHPLDIVKVELKVFGEKYLPGVRSFMMCHHYSHLICRGGVSECYKDITNFGSRLHSGTTTTLNKHSYMALIGYEDKSYHPEEKIVAFCGGTIISEKHVLTSATCYADYAVIATHVAVGEERRCIGCISRDGEQIIEIEHIFIFPAYKENYFYHDIAVVRLLEEIKFDKFVRPACLFTDPFKKLTEGTVASYTTDDFGYDRILTPRNDLNPVYQPYLLVKEKTFMSIYVRSKGEAVITLAEISHPGPDDWVLEITIGGRNNTKTAFRVRHGTEIEIENWFTTPNIMRHDVLKQFYLEVKKDENTGVFDVAFGEEDNETHKPVLSWQLTKILSKFYGVSTPGLYGGEWALVAGRNNGKVPQETGLDIIYSDKCTEHYVNRSEHLNEQAKLYDKIMFCAQNKTHAGPCNEDYGSSLVVSTGPYCMWQVVGVFVRDPAGYGPFEEQHCGNFKPQIYTRVSLYYLTWLEYIVWGREFNYSSLNLEPPICISPTAGPKSPGQC